MKKQIFVLLIAAMLAGPVPGFAMKGMDHSDQSKQMTMEQGGTKVMDHGQKMAHDGMAMIMLQDEEVDGVMASGHLMDVKEKMAEHGMVMTHHLMIGFMNTEGEGIEKGQVAVKVESPDGKISPALKMMGMDGQFGSDVTLDQQGMYHFKIGTKLADGKKRMYHMHYEVK